MDVNVKFTQVRDDLEDDELQESQLREGMPTSMAGFKDHPLYVTTASSRSDLS